MFWKKKTSDPRNLLALTFTGIIQVRTIMQLNSQNASKKALFTYFIILVSLIRMFFS